jgi:hypothetical protein
MRRWRRAALALAALGLLAGGASAWRLDYRAWAPEVVRRLPASETLVYVDLRPLRALLPTAPSGGSGYAAFVRDSGFDYTRDLDQLGLALRGDPARPTSACAILQGRFGPRFTAYLNHHAGRRVQVAGLAAWRFPGWARPAQAMTLALVARDVLVVTNAPDPAADLRRARSAWRPAPPQWRAVFWRPRPLAYLGADTLTLAAERHLDGQRPPWAGARWARISLRAGPAGGLTLEAREQADAPQAAARTQAWIATQRQSLAAALAQAPAPGAELAALLARVRLRRDGARLRARLRLSLGQARALLPPRPGN